MLSFAPPQPNHITQFQLNSPFAPTASILVDRKGKVMSELAPLLGMGANVCALGATIGNQIAQGARRS
jgi:hypothetical protein